MEEDVDESFKAIFAKFDQDVDTKLGKKELIEESKMSPKELPKSLDISSGNQQ